MTRAMAIVGAAVGLAVLPSVPAASQELIFADGFGSGEIWGWDLMAGGSTAVGSCPYEVATAGDEFFVDPVHGSDVTGDGSAANPWASIQHAVSNRIDCTNQTGTPPHPGAPVEGGDTIVLVGATGHDIDGTPHDEEPDVGAFEAPAP